MSLSEETNNGWQIMYERKGNDRFAPPELLDKWEYNEVNIDLFAAGIFLFVMVVGFMPTCKRADWKDLLYGLI